MLDAVVLGLLQGIVEWLPISSEGAVTAASTLLFDRSVHDSILYALWLHLGTALSAVVAFYREIVGVVREAVTRPRRPTPFMIFLVLASLISGAIGFPMLLLLDQVSAALGALAMGIVGLLMLVTGALQLRKPPAGGRTREHLTPMDAVTTGIAQGFAALPGLSRSGITVAALLARGIDRREALALSFLISIPAATAAALYAGLKEELLASPEALLSGGIAFVTGLVTIRALIALAGRIQFAPFVLVVGLALIVAAIIQVVAL